MNIRRIKVVTKILGDLIRLVSGDGAFFLQQYGVSGLQRRLYFKRTSGQATAWNESECALTKATSRFCARTVSKCAIFHAWFAATKLIPG
jgi:hypothetical protein